MRIFLGILCAAGRSRGCVRTFVGLAAAVGAPLLADGARGATAAYWRHEEGPAGSLVPDGPDTVLDSSGNGNHMQTFSSAFADYTSPTYSASVPPLR